MLLGKYASRHSEARYPSLWEGLVGAWCPSIQSPSGTTLYDLSGRNRHGTLTNMDVGTSWSLINGRRYLSFDGSNDRVVTSVSQSQFGSLSVSALVRMNAVSQIHAIIAQSNSGDTDASWGLYVLGNFSNRPAFKVNGNWSNIFSGASITSGAVVHLAAVFTAGVSVDVYINGVPTTWPLAFTPTSSTRAITIGSESVGTNRNQCSGAVTDVCLWNRRLFPSEVVLLEKQSAALLESRRSISLGSAFRFRRNYSQIFTSGVIG